MVFDAFDHSMLNTHRAQLKIDIRPTQPQNFTAPKSHCSCYKHRCVNCSVFYFAENKIKLLCVEKVTTELVTGGKFCKKCGILVCQSVLYGKFQRHLDVRMMFPDG